jgi:hypothetical protein
MPWTPAQHRLFEAAAHNPSIAKTRGIPQQKASQMASEGIKSGSALSPSHDKRKRLIAALRAPQAATGALRG